MTYFDGFQTWGQCRRCMDIRVVYHYPDRRGFLVPLCSDCAEDGAELLASGKSVVRPTVTHRVVEHPFLAEDYDIIEE